MPHAREPADGESARAGPERSPSTRHAVHSYMAMCRRLAVGSTFCFAAAPATTVALLVVRPAGSKQKPSPPPRPTATILIVRDCRCLCQNALRLEIRAPSRA